MPIAEPSDPTYGMGESSGLQQTMQFLGTMEGMRLRAAEEERQVQTFAQMNQVHNMSLRKGKIELAAAEAIQANGEKVQAELDITSNPSLGTYTQYVKSGDLKRYKGDLIGSMYDYLQGAIAVHSNRDKDRGAAALFMAKNYIPNEQTPYQNQLVNLIRPLIPEVALHAAEQIPITIPTMLDENGKPMSMAAGKALEIIQNPGSTPRQIAHIVKLTIPESRDKILKDLNDRSPGIEAAVRKEMGLLRSGDEIQATIDELRKLSMGPVPSQLEAVAKIVNFNVDGLNDQQMAAFANIATSLGKTTIKVSKPLMTPAGTKKETWVEEPLSVAMQNIAGIYATDPESVKTSPYGVHMSEGVSRELGLYMTNDPSIKASRMAQLKGNMDSQARSNLAIVNTRELADHVSVVYNDWLAENGTVQDAFAGKTPAEIQKALIDNTLAKNIKPIARERENKILKPISDLLQKHVRYDAQGNPMAPDDKRPPAQIGYVIGDDALDIDAVIQLLTKRGILRGDQSANVSYLPQQFQGALTRVILEAKEQRRNVEYALKHQAASSTGMEEVGSSNTEVVTNPDLLKGGFPIKVGNAWTVVPSWKIVTDPRTGRSEQIQFSGVGEAAKEFRNKKIKSYGTYSTLQDAVLATGVKP